MAVLSAEDLTQRVRNNTNISEADIRDTFMAGNISLIIAEAKLQLYWEQNPSKAPPGGDIPTSASSLVNEWQVQKDLASDQADTTTGGEEEGRASSGTGGNEGTLAGETVFTQEELDAAEQLLGGTRQGRFNIFERERTPGPTINPLLRNIQQQAFNPLSAAGFLTAASKPADAFDFTSFIQNQQNQPINTRAGFGSFGQGGTAGTGLLGNVQSALFGGGNLSPGQAAARQILEQQASPILQTIGSAGINPFFQDAARSDIARRIRGLSALEQENPFAAFVGGSLNF